MTQKLVRGILIDPFAKTVTEVQHDASDYRQIYKALTTEEHPVDCFTVIVVEEEPEEAAMYLDDEGLLNGRTCFFIWNGYAQPLAGKALILGTDDEGETIGTSMPLDYAKGRVVFCGEQDGERVLEAFPPRVIPLNGPGEFERYMKTGELPGEQKQARGWPPRR